MTIQPTIGRKVWYWPHEDGGLNVYDANQACDATVVYVWSDTCVNLRVTDHAGNTVARTSVRLVQDEERPARQSHATWMPYQLGQAARATQGS